VEVVITAAVAAEEYPQGVVVEAAEAALPSL
jgi:hypothetical protein